MMRKWMVGFATMVALSACGSDGGTGGPSTVRVVRGDTDSGTPGANGATNDGASTLDPALDSKKASTLSTKESSAFCAWLLTLDDQNLTPTQYCTQSASDEAATKRECEMLRDQCVADGDEAPTEDPDCTAFAFSKNCTATVGEVKTCLNDIVKVMVAITKRATCDDLTVGRAPDKAPASCSKIGQACLSFVEEL